MDRSYPWDGPGHVSKASPGGSGRDYPAAAGALLDDLAAGRSGLVSVTGGPGSGKSSALLAVDRAATARPGALVLRARCSPDEYDFSLGVVRQLLAPVMGRSELDDRLGALWAGGDPPGPAALHRLFLTLADAARTDRGAGDVLPVLVVDDAQWADEPSARFLAHLARRLHQFAILLVVGYDPREPSPNAAVLAQLAGDPAAVIWPLGPMDRSAVAAACRARLGTDDPAIVERCAELTHGVPFLLTELLAHAGRERARSGGPVRPELLDCAPMNVATLAITRARRHGNHLPAVLGALSVLRTPVSLAQAAEVTGLSPAAAEDALAILGRLSLVTVDGPAAGPGRAGIAVTPELVRRAVCQALHPSERHDAEARAARALAGDERTREAAALHLVETYPAGDPAHVAILREVATEAAARGAAERAATLLRRALIEPPDSDQLAEIHAELGSVELCFDPTSAVNHLRIAYESAVAPEERAERALRLGYGMMLLNQAAAAGTVLDRELATAELPAEHPLRTRLRAELVLARLGDDDPQSVTELPTTVDGSDRAGRQALAVRALAGAFACRPMAEVVRDAQAALGGEVVPGEDGSIGVLAASAVLIWGDELAGADRFLAQFARDCARRGEVLCGTLAVGLRGLVAIRHGDLGTAVARLTAAGALAARAEAGQPGHDLAALALALELAVEREEPNLVPYHAGELPQRWLGGLALAGRGRVRVLTGDVRRGLADLIEAGHRLDRIGCLNPAIVAWRSAAAQAHALLGNETEAATLAESEVDLARVWGAPRALAVALRRRGQLRRGIDGLSDLDEALAVLGPDGFPLERARTLLDRGRTLRTLRQPGLARAALTTGYDLAVLSGAERLAARIQDELLACGGRPRIRSHRDGPLLTGGEERVARMAIDGFTNEEIARRLYLARRTVESHLTSTYRKLNIRGRTQLAAALSRREPGGPGQLPAERSTVDRGAGDSHLAG